jgi:hypothetical protein
MSPAAKPVTVLYMKRNFDKVAISSLKLKDWRKIHLIRRRYKWKDTKRLTVILFAVIVVIFIDMGKACGVVSGR